jgi:hypothetical protein
VVAHIFFSRFSFPRLLCSSNHFQVVAHIFFSRVSFPTPFILQ